MARVRLNPAAKTSTVGPHLDLACSAYPRAWIWVSIPINRYVVILDWMPRALNLGTWLGESRSAPMCQWFCYSWIACRLQLEVAPVLGLSGTNFRSETSFGKLWSRCRQVTNGKFDYRSNTSSFFMFSFFGCVCSFLGPKIALQTSSYWYLVVARAKLAIN